MNDRSCSDFIANPVMDSLCYTLYVLYVAYEIAKEKTPTVVTGRVQQPCGVLCGVLYGARNVKRQRSDFGF